jgi:hypothetical protein
MSSISVDIAAIALVDHVGPCLVFVLWATVRSWSRVNLRDVLPPAIHRGHGRYVNVYKHQLIPHPVTPVNSSLRLSTFVR